MLKLLKINPLRLTISLIATWLFHFVINILAPNRINSQKILIVSILIIINLVWIAIGILKINQLFIFYWRLNLKAPDQLKTNYNQITKPIKAIFYIYLIVIILISINNLLNALGWINNWMQLVQASRIASFIISFGLMIANGLERSYYADVDNLALLQLIDYHFNSQKIPHPFLKTDQATDPLVLRINNLSDQQLYAVAKALKISSYQDFSRNQLQQLILKIYQAQQAKEKHD